MYLGLRDIFLLIIQAHAIKSANDYLPKAKRKWKQYAGTHKVKKQSLGDCTWDTQVTRLSMKTPVFRREVLLYTLLE